MMPGGLDGWRTEFIKPPEGVLDHPVAFLAEDSPNHTIETHFHQVDQFQVVVTGGGTLGKHELAINAVHFSRAYTPYGPIAGDQRGVGFLTLRAHWDPGAQYVEANREKLLGMPGRRPWQATELPEFAGEAAVNLHAFTTLRDERGLAAYSLRLAPGATTATPDASGSNGQFIIVARGSVRYQKRERGATSVCFIRPDEGSFQLEAGPAGADVLVLNFPRPDGGARRVAEKSGGQVLRVWQCQLCAFVYDEAEGMPDEGVAPGTRWSDVPDSWTCPDCGAGKADFDMLAVA